MGKKKGQTVTSLWILIEAVLITLATLIFFQYILSVENNTLFEQKFLARDVALMANTMAGIPGEMRYEYISEANISKFVYIFKEDKVQVNAKDSSIQSSYPFYHDSEMNIDYKDLDSPKKLTFARTESSLKINENIKQEKVNVCEKVEGKKFGIVTVDYDDDSKAYADALMAKLGANPNIVAGLARTEDSTESERIESIKSAEMLISFGKDSDVVKYAKREEDSARYLACLITKNMKTQGSTATFTSTDTVMVSNVGIGIRILAESDPDKVAVSIASALREYNG